MNFNFLDKKRVRIAHLSDIHIKDKRREEYAKMFKKLYEQLRLKSPDVIAVCGDIFHDKTKATAHNYMDVESFLTALTEIALVVLIPGNHDLNIKVPGAPDLISPVISNHTILKEPRLFYWRNSGVYVAYGIIWIVIAPDGPHPSVEEIEKVSLTHKLENTARICLIHETIDGTRLYNDTLLRDKRLKPADLIMYDAVLAGDIHLRQAIGKNKRAMYAGSLIQQNIGESHTGHGFLIWELELSANCPPYRTALPKIHAVNIPNEQGFLKIKLEAGIDVTKQPCPTAPNYYELIYDENTTKEKLDFHVKRLTQTYGIPPQATRLISKETPGASVENNFSTLSQAQIDAQSLATHKEMITDILGEKNSYLQQVIDLHQNHYVKTLNQERTRARVRLLKLRFSNLYCYGQENVIDFTKLESSLSGAIAPNKAGKSTLIDIIVFALYDKCPRAEQKLNIFNAKSSQYHLVLDFELDGKRGYIEKRGHKKRKAHIAQYRLVYDNKELTQGTNTLTCQEIEKLVGTYANAELTSILHQDNRNDFVWLNSSERKKALAQLLALGSFEKLEKEIKEENYKLNIKLSALEEEFQGKEKDELIKERESIINLNNKEKKKVQDLDIEISLKEKTRCQINEEKEQVAINLSMIRDKIANLEPQIQTNLGDAEAELKKVLKLVAVDNELSPSEEYKTYQQAVADNFSENLSLESLIMPTRNEVLNVVNQAREAQRKKKEQESQILLDINSLEAKKARITTLLETSLTSLQENYQRVKIDIKTLKAETPCVEKPSTQELWWSTAQKGIRPALEETIKAKNDLVSFQHDQTSARNVILQHLAIITNNLVPPIQDEKIGEYEELINLCNKDQELVSSKKLLEEELQSAKLKLKDAQATEKTHQPDLLKKVKERSLFTENKKKLDAIIVQQKVEDTKVKLLAAKNAQQIRRQLRLQEGCIGCEYTKSLFTENKTDALQKDLEEALLESAFLAVRDTFLAKEKVKQLESELHRAELAQIRLERLSKIKGQREEFADYESRVKERNHWQQKMTALEILERAAYWQTEDKMIWIEYELAAEQLEKIRILREELASASQELSQRRLLLAELTHLEIEAQQNEAQCINLRKIGLKKVIDAFENCEIAKSNEKNRAERHKLQLELQLTEDKIMNLKKRIFVLESELTELRVQRDKTVGLIASLTSEVERLTKALNDEDKRINLLVATQEKLNVISAYRTILDPKTGIANYLLKRSRTYLESAVNAVLGECGSSFSVYINDEFELNTTADADNQSEQNSELFLSAKLGSGYQKFVLSLAFRMALWRLAEVSLPNCHFIDEGFGCCDEDNLEAVIQYLITSASSCNSPCLVFIVSHIESLKNAIQKPLMIKVNPEGSKVRNETNS